MLNSNFSHSDCQVYQNIIGVKIMETKDIGHIGAHFVILLGSIKRKHFNDRLPRSPAIYNNTSAPESHLHFAQGQVHLIVEVILNDLEDLGVAKDPKSAW